MSQPIFRALLIGADFYFPNRLPNGGTYLSLSGAVNDSLRVEAMLRERIRAQLDIHTLRARRVSGSKEPPEPASEWPTYANITEAFRRLVERTESGDQVFIHYSGHGGRVPTDKRFKDLKGADGVDETLVPIDIADKSTRHVRDLDIAYFLQQLTDKGAVVTVVLDSCHSAGATRSTSSTRPESAVRSATGGVGDGIDTTERPEGGVAPEAELASAWKRLSDSRTRAARLGPSFLPDAKGYVLLAACAAHESALEVGIGNGRGGLLTSALLRVVSSLSLRDTWQSSYNQIYADVHSLAEQTPQLLGDVSRKVFGVDLLPVRATMTVVEIDKTEGRARVDAGLTAGLAVGARLAMYAPTAVDFAPEQRKAVAIVVETEEASSWATVEEGIDDIELGARVAVTDLGPNAQRRVRLVDKDAPAMAALREEIVQRAGGFLALAADEPSADEKPVHYCVAIDAGSYVVTSAAGEPFERLGAPLSVTDPASVPMLVNRLLHLAEYHRKLAITSPPSDFSDAIDVEASLAPPGYHPQKNPLPGGEPLLAEGENVVPADSYVRITLKNRSPLPVFVAIFDFQDDWAVNKLIPSRANEQYVTVDENKTEEWPIEVFVPEDRAETRDLFKIFVSVAPLKLGFFAMPELAPSKRGALRHARPEEPKVRASEQWVVRQFAVRVRKAKT